MCVVCYDEKGLVTYKKKDYATALYEWKPLAEQGHVGAQTALKEIKIEPGWKFW